MNLSGSNQRNLTDDERPLPLGRAEEDGGRAFLASRSSGTGDHGYMDQAKRQFGRRRA